MKGGDDLEKFVIDVSPQMMDLRRELEAIAKEEKHIRHRLMTEKNVVLMNALKAVMATRLKDCTTAAAAKYINLLQSVSGKKDMIVLCFRAASKETFLHAVVTATEIFINVDGIPRITYGTSSLPRAVRLLIEKGLFDVYKTLEKKMDESLAAAIAAAEPVAKRSKIDSGKK